MASDANSIANTVTGLYWPTRRLSSWSSPRLPIQPARLVCIRRRRSGLILMPMQQRFTMLSYNNNKELLKARDKTLSPCSTR